MTTQFLTGDISSATNLAGQPEFAAHLVKNAIDAHAPIPMCKVFNSVSQSIANDAITPLSFNGEELDTDNMHDLVTNNSRITCKTAGEYLVTANIYFDNNATGIRSVIIRKTTTGAPLEIAREQGSAFTGGGLAAVVTTLINLSVNDYLDVCAYQTSGGALSIMALSYSPYFSAVKVG